MLSESNFVFVESENVKRDKYKMPDCFKVIVTCDPRDEYDFEVGTQIAKKRIMDKYYKALDKRMQMFTDSLVDLAHRTTMQRCDEFEKKKSKKF